MADKRAFFRAKLVAKNKKRIDSPLVRYNEWDKPVCRVCDVVLKSDSDWMAHQASRRHHEAVNNIKASASKKNMVNNAKSEIARELPRFQNDGILKSKEAKPEMPSDVQKTRSSSVLPADFFDNKEPKRQKVGSNLAKQVAASKEVVPSLATISMHDENQPVNVPDNTGATKQVKGALPEGFFDNKEADLRARGIELVKPDSKEKYKEFEKLIQGDLAEVDNRMEEEEVDAAEMIEEEEMVEQRTYWDRVEMLKRKKAEVLAARSLKIAETSKTTGTSTDQDESSSEDEDNESFAVDWRAKHL